MGRGPVVKIPIDGVLDLHTFQPGEVKDLLNDYIEECLKKEIYELRIIHGKGTGTLKPWSEASSKNTRRS